MTKRQQNKNHGTVYPTVIKPKGIKVICTILISLCMLQSVYAIERKTSKKINVLFLGNSFTYAADIPKIFKKMFDEGKSGKNADVTTVAYGGSNLFMHWHIYRSQNIVKLQSLSKPEMKTQIEELKNIPQDPPDLFLNGGSYGREKATKIWNRRASKKSMKLVIRRHNKWLEMIGNTPGWDYVVLQNWKDMDKSKPGNFFEYASRFSALAKKNGAKVVLYITSPYSQNMKPVKKPSCVERVFKDTLAAKKFARKINALVVPMPLAIYYAQQERPDITFRYVNNFHLNHNSAYLAACLMYVVITNKSPEGLKYNEVRGLGSKPDVDHDGNPRQQFIDIETRTYLQKLAWKTIQAFNNNNLERLFDRNAEETRTEKNVKEPPKVVNLLRNGGFEDGKNGIWKANFTLELEHNDVVEGKTALKVPEDVKSFRICQYYKKGEGDDTFKLKCKVKGPAGRRIYSALVLDYKKNGVNKCQKKNSKKLALNGEWQDFVWTFKPEKYTGWLLILIKGNAGGIIFDDVSLAKVKKENKE